MVCYLQPYLSSSKWVWKCNWDDSVARKWWRVAFRCRPEGWPPPRDSHFPLRFFGGNRRGSDSATTDSATTDTTTRSRRRRSSCWRSNRNRSNSSRSSSIVFPSVCPTPVTCATLQLVTRLTNYISIIFELYSVLERCTCYFSVEAVGGALVAVAMASLKLDAMKMILTAQ